MVIINKFYGINNIKKYYYYKIHLYHYNKTITKCYNNVFILHIDQF